MPSNSQNFQSMLEWLYALQRRGIKVGLSHTRELLAGCGNPQNRFPSIHLAGTNGKGSTTAMIAAILKAVGYKVGMYTSPHLVHFNERIRVNGRPIHDAEIVEFITLFRAQINQVKSTFFEATTAMALWYFAREKVDVAVIETGLGGRFDSTNVLNPVVTVITPVDLDHTELLGDSIESIAMEKAGIIKSDTPVILAPQVEKAEEILRLRAREVTASVFPVEGNFDKATFRLDSGSGFVWRGKQYSTALLGKHQILNAACALEAVQVFNPRITTIDCQKGLSKVQWPGRLQLLSERPPIFYDVAHNPHGIKAIIDNLNCIFAQFPVGILALKGDKELTLIAEALRGRLKQLIVTSIPGTDLIPAKILAQRLNEYKIECVTMSSIDDAIGLMAMGITNEIPGLIFGSHYIAESVFQRFDFFFESGVI